MTKIDREYFYIDLVEDDPIPQEIIDDLEAESVAQEFYESSEGYNE